MLPGNVRCLDCRCSDGSTCPGESPESQKAWRMALTDDFLRTQTTNGLAIENISAGATVTINPGNLVSNAVPPEPETVAAITERLELGARLFADTVRDMKPHYNAQEIRASKAFARELLAEIEVESRMGREASVAYKGSELASRFPWATIREIKEWVEG